MMNVHLSLKLFSLREYPFILNVLIEGFSFLFFFFSFVHFSLFVHFFSFYGFL